MPTRFYRTPVSEYADYVPRRRMTSAELADRHCRSESPTAVVYYARRPDGCIKIGTSDHLATLGGAL